MPVWGGKQSSLPPKDNAVPDLGELQDADGPVGDAIPYTQPPRASMLLSGMIDDVEEKPTYNCLGMGMKDVFKTKKEEDLPADWKETATAAASKEKEEDDSLRYHQSDPTISSLSSSKDTPLRLLNRIQKQYMESELKTAKQMSQSAISCRPSIVITTPVILPSYTPNLACTLLTWHFTMNNVFARSTSDVLLYSSPMFPFPPTRPKCVPLIALSFWDTGSSSGQKELIRLEPGDVEVMKYNEVDAFAPFEPYRGDEKEKAKKWNMGKMFKKKNKEKLEAEEAIGDGRWCFICIRGLKERGREESCDATRSAEGDMSDGDEAEQSQRTSSTFRNSSEHSGLGSDDSASPWLFLAFPIAAITRHSECIRQIHEATPEDNVPPNHQSNASSFSLPLPNKIVSMPDLTAMLKGPAVARLPSAVRSLSSSALGRGCMEEGRQSDEPDCKDIEASRAYAGGPKKIFQSASTNTLPRIDEDADPPPQPAKTQYLSVLRTPSPDLHSPTTASCSPPMRAGLPLKIFTETPRPAYPPHIFPPLHGISSDNSMPLRRTTLHFNTSGNIPLIESHGIDLKEWKPVLSAFARGKAKMMLWTSEEDRILNADGLLKLGLIPYEGSSDDE